MMPIKKYLHERTLYKRVEKVSPSPPPSTSSASLQSLNRLSTAPSSVRSSPSRSHQYIDDEYNPYKYGLVPLSERNIYREFQVIQPPKDMIWKEDITEHRVQSMNGVSNGKSASVERIIKPVLAESVTSKASAPSRSKTVRIVESPQKSSTASSRQLPKTTPSTSSISKRETVIPISHFESEPVPTTFSSFKCTKYTLNEIRSF